MTVKRSLLAFTVIVEYYMICFVIKAILDGILQMSNNTYFKIILFYLRNNICMSSKFQ